MDARGMRPQLRWAAGTCAALSLAVLAGCASGQVSGPPASAPTTSGRMSSAPAPSSSSAQPAPSTASAAPTDQPSNGPNAITSPTPGATVSGPDVTVTGTGTAFEATLLWEAVPAGGGAAIAHGFTSAGANGAVGPFSFTTTLPAGRVTLSVWEPDMSDGAAGGAPRRNLVTVTFAVR